MLSAHERMDMKKVLLGALAFAAGAIIVDAILEWTGR
jgi:ABC-type proline/glycine betaine transport system permease subunit